MSIKLDSSTRVHPGEWLKSEIIAAHGMSVPEAADRLRVSPQALSQLLNKDSSLSWDMALQFERLFGLNAETLMQMQVDYDFANDEAKKNEI